MFYEEVIQDFAKRTRANLEFVQKIAQDDLEAGSEPQVYEVTQLVNSLLGLLVFPQQNYYDYIPETPLDELEEQGWPAIRARGNFPDAKNLRDLMRLLRNSISHFNIKFTTKGGQLSGLCVWNEKENKKKTWETEITLEQLETLSFKIVDCLDHWREYERQHREASRTDTAET